MFTLFIDYGGQKIPYISVPLSLGTLITENLLSLAHFPYAISFPEQVGGYSRIGDLTEWIDTVVSKLVHESVKAGIIGAAVLNPELTAKYVPLISEIIIANLKVGYYYNDKISTADSVFGKRDLEVLSPKPGDLTTSYLVTLEKLGELGIPTSLDEHGWPTASDLALVYFANRLVSIEKVHPITRSHIATKAEETRSKFPQFTF
jgi:hypothetical protein